MAESKPIYNPSMTIRMSPEMSERLERVASMYGVTRGEVARMAIGQYVGQITGAMDQMAKNQVVDYEKLVDVMIPKLIEAEKKFEIGQPVCDKNGVPLNPGDEEYERLIRAGIKSL